MSVLGIISVEKQELMIMFFPETIETLEQFKQRTSFVHYPFSAEPISINPNCGKKVSERGESERK